MITRQAKQQFLKSIEQFIMKGGVVFPLRYGGFRGAEKSDWNTACAIGAAVDEDPEKQQGFSYFGKAAAKFGITNLEAAEISDGFEHGGRGSEAHRFGNEIYRRYVTGRRSALGMEK